MSEKYEPKIGDWYKNATGQSFEVVALDEDDGTVEIQHFDGMVEELDLDTWHDLDIEPIEPPEDWSGSLDIEREDYGVDLERDSSNDWANPFDELE